MDVGWSMTFQNGKKHVLIIPVILQAHLVGIFRLAVELAKRDVTITMVLLGKEIALFKTFDEVRELDINLVSYKDSETNWTISMFLASVRKLFQPIFDKLLEDRKAGLPGPTCIIGDRFLPWAIDIAKELNIPYYQFYSCGAIFVRSLQAFSELFADGTLAMKEARPGGKRSLAEFEGSLKIPGLPTLEFRDMTNSALGTDFTNSLGIAIGKADGVIVNTFYELESPPIDAIRQFWTGDSRGNIPKLFLVGPLSNAATFKDRSFVENLDNRGTDCLQWLDRRSPQSVVYVCLGSIVRLNPEQIQDLATALEASGQSFVWVMTPRGSEEDLPPNFEARTRERGLIVNGWVPQLEILGHSAIGGFVTHCGWNSIIESILSGVPMAAWPQLHNDQFVNCRYIVDVLRIAIEVRPPGPNGSAGEGATVPPSTGPKKQEGFAKAVTLLMSEEGNACRSRIQELKKKAEAAVADGGVSTKALHDLVNCIPPP